MRKILAFALLCFLLPKFSYSQSNIWSLGTAFGIGEIKSNSPSQTSFNGAIFIDFKPEFAEDFSFRFNFIYARHINYFLPENQLNKYYPFMKAFAFKICTEQKIEKLVFAEEGIGLLVLNDRTFSDINYWNYGLSFSALIGLNFRDQNLTGFTFGIGVDYGTTFNNSAANYYSTYLQIKYSF